MLTITYYGRDDAGAEYIIAESVIDDESEAGEDIADLNAGGETVTRYAVRS